MESISSYNPQQLIGKRFQAGPGTDARSNGSCHVAFPATRATCRAQSIRSATGSQGLHDRVTMGPDLNASLVAQGTTHLETRSALAGDQPRDR